MESATQGPDQPKATWRPTQAYVLAAVCLVIGLPVGYLLRGSAPAKAPAPAVATMPETQAPPTAAAATAPMPHSTVPTLDDMKRMADKRAEPLLAKLKADPNNAELLNQTGILYRSAHQFKQAEDYFQKSLAIDPKNVNVRTDMAACMFYDGDVDGALAELQKSLTYDPKHAGTLMNIGIIKWKGKNDVPGAVASWQKLLKLNPDFKQKAVVERMISDAQQSAKTEQATTPRG